MKLTLLLVGKPYEKDDIYTEKKLYYSTPTYDELKAQVDNYESNLYIHQIPNGLKYTETK